MTSCVQLWCSSKLWDPVPSAVQHHQKPVLGLGSFPNQALLEPPSGHQGWQLPRAIFPGSWDSYVRWETILFFQVAKPANPCLIIPKHHSDYSSTSVKSGSNFKGVRHPACKNSHLSLKKKNTTFEGIKIEIIQNPRMSVLAHRRWQMAEPWIDTEEDAWRSRLTFQTS